MVAVGFIGLGHMGGPMARRLLEPDADLVVFDIDRAAVDAVVEAGAARAETARDAAAEADVVFLCLPSNIEVEAVVLGEDGIAPALEPGDVLVDTTTSVPETSARVGAALSERRVGFLGAPISGGEGGAERGTLTVMVGGDASDLEAVRPLLESFATTIVHVGSEPGHGHAMKLLNNYLSYVSMVATTEAAIAGQDLGLDLETMLEVINHSSGRNSWTEDKFPDEVVPGTFDLGATLGIGEKDTDLGRAVLDQHGLDLGLVDLVLESIRAAKAELGADADLTEFYRFHRESAPRRR